MKTVNLHVIENLNDILEKAGFKCFFSLDFKTDKVFFRTFDGSLFDNNYQTKLKLLIDVENVINGGNENV